MTRQLTVPQQQVAAQEQLAPSPALILQAAVQGGVSKENVDVVERLAALMERQQDREAEQAFNRALCVLQTEMPNVQAKKIVPNKDGSMRYVYAPYEEIRRQVDPFLRQNGFSATFDATTSEDGKRVTVKCVLRHREGHSEATSYTGRIGSGPPMSSEAQVDGAGFTYAKRFAFCNALGIVVATDTDGADDARNIGATLTEQEADDLYDAFESVGGDRKVFLGRLGVQTDRFDDVPQARLQEAYEMIESKRRKQK